MDNNRNRMGKDRTQQHRAAVFKLLRRHRNPPLSTSASLRLVDHQNRNSFIHITKNNNKRSEYISQKKQLIKQHSFAY